MESQQRRDATWAARCGSAPTRAAPARARAWRRPTGPRDQRAASPPLRGEQRVPRRARRVRAAALGPVARRRAGRDRSSCRTIRGSSAASSIPSSSRGRRGRIRSSPASSAPPLRHGRGAAASPRADGARRDRALMGWSFARDAVSHRRPLRPRADDVLPRVAEALARLGASARAAGLLQGQLRQGQPRARRRARGPGLDEGLGVLERVRAASGLPVSPTSTCRSRPRRRRRSSTCCRSRPSSAGRPICSSRRAHRASR